MRLAHECPWPMAHGVDGGVESMVDDSLIIILGSDARIGLGYLLN